MAKSADEYFKLDPWKIIEDGWTPERNLVSESIFSLGNEYMGVRGYFEEGYLGENKKATTLMGSYFNGIYEEAKTANESAYRGIVNKTHFMVNAVDWLYTRISFEDEEFNMAFSKVSDFKRILNLADGTLTRSFIWTTRTGKNIAIQFTRFLDMEDSVYGFQQISIIPEGFNGPITVELGCNFDVLHSGRQKCFWTELKHEVTQKEVAIMASTQTTGQIVYSGFMWDSNRALTPDTIHSERFAGLRFELPLMNGEESILEKKVCNYVEKDWEVLPLVVWSMGEEKRNYLKEIKTTAFKIEQKKYWDEVWKRLDIKIDGDDKNQQGIRYCIFQMQQTYHGQNPSNNIGAKGLTGEAYNGHAFWDTETYCLPFYLFSNLKAARNLLEFRYETLSQAKKRAKMLDCTGACFPVATLNGEEACDLWQHASLQFQPSTAVAYGIAHYVHLSGDEDFLYGHGAEMLVEISRFLLSRGAWSQTSNGFGYYGVMGPDEFHMMVNNNCYTNYMAKKTFEFTLETLNSIPENKRKVLFEKTLWTENESLELKRCAENMIILYENKTKLYEQHEGFFDLPHIEINSIPQADFPLYHHWSYDRIYRTDMIKQPDVLMGMFLYSNDFSQEVIRENYEYYEPRTIHESSLSPSIHSVFASQLKKHEEAFKFFGFATRMDLDNYNRNTGEGLHTTSIAAAWVNIVYGFGGMRSDGRLLSFAPSLPAQWKGYEFRIEYKAKLIKVLVSENTVELTLIGEVKEDERIDIELYGEECTLGSKGLQQTLPAGSRG